jgi:lysophospholipase L1-like esterase
VLLGALSVVLALSIGEGLLRAVDYSYTPLDIEVAGEQLDWRFEHAFRDDNFEFDPERIWRPRPGHSVFNELGYRGRVLAARSDGAARRILALGDSNTLGWAGEDGPNWPDLLEQRLTESGRDVIVINGGVWGYSSYQGLKHFERLLALEPDLVLVSFGGNDAHRVRVSDAGYVAGLDDSLRFLYRFRLGQLALAIRERFSSRADEGTGSEPVFRVSPEEYIENLTRFAELSRERGIECVLMTRPFLGESTDESWWRTYAPQYVDATLESGRELGAPVIDVYAAFADKRRFFADESHFNERGHRKAAKLIADRIKPLLDR